MHPCRNQIFCDPTQDGHVIDTYLLIPLENFEAMASKALHSSLDGFVIGVIGMGDMGKMYARRLSDAGWR